jgi:hypothetical protein
VLSVLLELMVKKTTCRACALGCDQVKSESVCATSGVSIAHQIGNDEQECMRGLWDLRIGVLLWLAVATPLLWTGCDAPMESIEALEERLTDQTSTQNKAGTLRAIEVRYAAGAITQRMAASPEASCRLQLPSHQAFTYHVSLDVQRTSAAGVYSRWNEARTLRRDDDGDLAATMDADFRTELGDHGHRSPQWRLVDQQSYVSVAGRAFYKRRASAGERTRLSQSASGTLQSLLDASSKGWSREGRDEAGTAVFTMGGDRLVCGPSIEGEVGLSVNDGWLRRFETRATPLGGELSVPEVGPRRLEMRWQLEDGSTLEVRFEDRLVDGAQSVEAPEESKLVSVERDRSLERVEELIDEMSRRGLAEDVLIDSGRTNNDAPIMTHQ